MHRFAGISVRLLLSGRPLRTGFAVLPGSNMEILGDRRSIRSVRTILAIILIACSPVPTTPVAAQTGWRANLDPLLQARVSVGGRSRVVLQGVGSDAVSSVLSLLPLAGGRVVRSTHLLSAHALDIPNTLLPTLAG